MKQSRAIGPIAISISGALVLGVALTASTTTAFGKQSRPSQPPPRICPEAQAVFEIWSLLAHDARGVDSSSTIVLAKVQSAERTPADARALSLRPPDLDSLRLFPARSGLARTVEVLHGRSVPAAFRIDHSAYFKALDASMQPAIVAAPQGSGALAARRVVPPGEVDWELRHPPATLPIRPGEYWLLVCDSRTGEIDQSSINGTTWLSGPEDPLVHAVRRHDRWLKRLDRASAMAGARALALDKGASAVARTGALYSFIAMTNLKGEQLFEQGGRAYGPIRHLLADLVRQGGIPLAMKPYIIQTTYIDGSIDPASSHDQATMLHYLIDCVLHEADGHALGNAAQKLVNANLQSGKVDGKPVAYFYPDIVLALEARQAADLARDPSRGSLVRGEIEWLDHEHRRRVEDVKDVAVVVRRIPLDPSTGR